MCQSRPSTTDTHVTYTPSLPTLEMRQNRPSTQTHASPTPLPSWNSWKNSPLKTFGMPQRQTKAMQRGRPDRSPRADQDKKGLLPRQARLFMTFQGVLPVKTLLAVLAEEAGRPLVREGVTIEAASPCEGLETKIALNF